MKNDSTLCGNIRELISGFWHRHLLLSAIGIFRTSSCDNCLPDCFATACTISGQCKSAADKVRNQVGIPNLRSIATDIIQLILPICRRTSHIFQELVCLLISYQLLYCFKVMHKSPAVIFWPPTVLPHESLMAKFISLSICLIYAMC